MAKSQVKGLFRVLGKKPDLLPAIVELQNSLRTMKTNAPINEREGNYEQANLEKANARSYQAAMQLLKKR